MPANWTVRSVVPNNGLIQVHLSRDSGAQHGEETILLNVAPERFPQAFMEGDLRDAHFPLIQRAGRNGKHRA